MFHFQYQRMPDSRARLGELKTPHGTIQTPAFIFCATKAAIKGVTPDEMRAAGTQIILSNTYHLMLQPGPETVHKLGGLQKMTGWNGPMLTDSGGFQIFSLGHGSVAEEIKGRRQTDRPRTLLKINEEGAKFRSYTNGSYHLLTPEESIRIQHLLGADLIVVLDECTPFHVDPTYTRLSMERSHRWAVRSLKAFEEYNNPKQALYGIIQGGVFPELRNVSTDFVNNQPFFGHAIGGSLGANSAQMDDVVSYTAEKLTPERPIHLLGIGKLRDMVAGVNQGIDTFDCVHPTRLARHGGALMWPGRHEKEHINLKQAIYRNDEQPIDSSCGCRTCQTASRGYLHHLLKAGEIVGLTLISIHNVWVMNKFMEMVREHLHKGTWPEFYQNFMRNRNA